MIRKRYALAGAVLVAVGLVAAAAFGALWLAARPAAAGANGVWAHGQGTMTGLSKSGKGGLHVLLPQ